MYVREFIRENGGRRNCEDVVTLYSNMYFTASVGMCLNLEQPVSSKLAQFPAITASLTSKVLEVVSNSSPGMVY